MVWDNTSVTINMTAILEEMGNKNATVASVEYMAILTQHLTVIVFSIAVLGFLFFYVAWETYKNAENPNCVEIRYSLMISFLAIIAYLIVVACFMNQSDKY